MNADDDLPLWVPDTARCAASGLAQFASRLQRLPGTPVRSGDWTRDYTALWRWSVEAPETFWREVLDATGIIAEGDPAPVRVGRDAMPGARWFPQLRLNYAENLLAGPDTATAVLFADEAGARQVLDRRTLKARVARVAAVLEDCGVVAGDVVAGYLPNVPEAVIAMLAATSLGAVWTSASPDFGLDALAERFAQVRPKVLFAAEGCRYAGRTTDLRPVLRALPERLPGLAHMLLIPGPDPDARLQDLAIARPLAELEATYTDRTQPHFLRLPFDAPLFILYSSGTTGRPKCIVHGIGGSLLQHRKEHLLHVDLRRDDRLFYFTTCGWMMWNWLVSGLAAGAAIVLYDGSPVHPSQAVLWDLAQAFGITHFGTSPRYLAALEKAGYRPAADHDLDALRTLLSTGSPLAPEQFDYVYRDVKPDVHLASISGGTDLLGCFCLGVPCLPVYRGELQAPGLGLAVAVWDARGHAVVGEEGELVCTAPFPSMPLRFANDPDGARYRAAYFARYPGVWHHGDYALATRHGGFVILGRSDATLNPGGVRIGTAEIYRQVERLPEVLESIAVGQKQGADERILLFVRLRPGCRLDAALERRIRAVIRDNTSPRHVPARILPVTDVPRTVSGKIAELAVRDAVHGRPVTNLEALANPQALDEYRDRADLRD